MIMQGAVTAVIAVAGTLLGAAITYLFQRMNAQRAEAFSFQQQLRSERMIVYSDFAKIVKEYQRAQDPKSKDAYDAFMKALDLGSSVQHALFRVELVADSSELIEKARYAYLLVNKLREASTKADLGSREDTAEEALGTSLHLQNAIYNNVWQRSQLKDDQCLSDIIHGVSSGRLASRTGELLCSPPVAATWATGTRGKTIKRSTRLLPGEPD